MSVKAMQKVSLKGPHAELAKVIEELKNTGVFELSSFVKKGKEIDNENPIVENHATLLARIEAALEYSKGAEAGFKDALKRFKKKYPADKTFEGKEPNRGFHNRMEYRSYTELKAMAEREHEVMGLVEKLEGNSTAHHEIRANIATNREIKTAVQTFAALETPFELLRDTETAFVMYGMIRADMLEKFRGDFNLENMVIESFGDGEDVGVVVIGHNDDLAVAEMINSYGFVKQEFAFEGTAADQIGKTDAEIERLEKGLLQNMLDSALVADDISLLKGYHDYVANEIDTANILSSVLKTKNEFILTGWVPKDDGENFARTIKYSSKGKVKANFEEVGKNDTPPALVKNSKLIEPYQSVTNMYGAPGKNDIDPNPFVAFFYFLFFGMMVGDLGYGLVLLCATLLVLRVLKPQSVPVRQLVMIMAMGAVSTILWGIFFGGLFGFEMPFGVIDPIDDAILFLGLAMLLGVFHVMAGIILNGVRLISQGKTMDAILDAGPRVLLFIGVILFIGGMEEMLSIELLNIPTMSDIGMYLVLVAVALIVLTTGRKRPGVAGKVIGGFGGVYGLVNYFSDILSYARLFGLGLVGAVIAQVANTMGGMFFEQWFLIPIGVVVAVLFHTFNLALCLLSAYIHNARLQFIEFFSKFYEGSGKLFRPMGSELKYTQLSPGLSAVKEEGV